MLVIFAAFKKEALNLIKLLKSKKTVKNKNTIIYDGSIKNKRVIICITGMGKSNSLFAAGQIIKMKLDNPVFMIQGISGALLDNFKIGDLVFYESIKNLEQFRAQRYAGENSSYNPDVQKQTRINENDDGYDERIQSSDDILYLPYGGSIKNIGMNRHYLSDLKESDAIDKIMGANLDLLKDKWELIIKDSRIFRSIGGLVSYVVTDFKEKNVLNRLHDVEVIDMESYYIADTAIRNSIPVICIRSISDNFSKPIPESIIGFNSGNIYFKFKCLINVIFSNQEKRSIIRSYKNINIACRNLNLFIEKILLPYFGYKL